MSLDSNDHGATFSDAFYEQDLPHMVNGYPNGWMRPADLKVLYNAARIATGPVLEVGPWLGRSTTALALGLRDRTAAGARPVPFDTLDLGITSAAEWEDRFGEPFEVDKDKGRVADAVYHPGGTIAVLIRNLKDNGLLGQMTNIIRGDLVTCPIQRDYGLIFCDATHSDAEIHRHLPRLAELAGPGCTLIFDDVVSRDRADLVCSFLNTKHRFLSRTLFPSPRKRCKLLVVETH